MSRRFSAQPLRPLANAALGGPPWDQWVRSGPNEATTDLSACLASSFPTDDFPFAAAPDFRNRLGEFASEKPAVVITGQQPGWLGGPLYTLYKIATTVAVARLRSNQGQPTVPVFWAGDDDDDVAEAYSAVAWDPLLGQFFKGGGRGISASLASERKVVGDLSAQAADSEARAWLESLAGHGSAGNGTAGSLSTALASLYGQAQTEKWTWSRLFSQGIQLLFPGSNLIIVRGNDPELHDLARPIYEQILPQLSRLQKLAAAGGQQAINARSIAHPLFRLEGSRRRRIDSFPDGWEPTLRPGVLLRSLIQDWLFRPAAVVVGPGEKAYLDQLLPLYRELGIPRSPLVPRLFSWLVPPGVSARQMQEVLSGANHTAADRELWTARISDRIEETLREIIQTGGGFSPAEAHHLARRKARRMTRHLPDYFVGVDHRALSARQKDLPPWVFPAGRRQERHMATFNALALWGAPLPETVLAAAEEHLRWGLKNQWQEMLISVPPPLGTTGKESADA